MSYFDREGKPLTTKEWGKLFEDKDYQRIALTTVGDKTVSTVWLGLNHACDGSGLQIFETMVFAKDSWLDEECWRYATEAEAIVGHHRMVMAVAATYPSDEEFQAAAEAAQALVEAIERELS